ncbi:MAG: BlaI/MecI/CopY family transcriptional regulator [Proteobacteria bacterium]|nr:BlaI/MecI/CopY family transcriptional regulator [Pseudomonadota bacterium]
MRINKASRCDDMRIKMRKSGFYESPVLSLPAKIRTELLVMEAFWAAGPLSVRQVFESIPEQYRPTEKLTRVTVNRLISNMAVRRSKQIGNYQVFEAVESRDVVYRRLVRSFEDLFQNETELNPLGAESSVRLGLAGNFAGRRASSGA